MVALASAGGDESSLANLKKSHTTGKGDLEKSLATLEEKLAEAERHVHEFEHNKDTLSALPTRVNKAESKLKSSEEQVYFLEDKLSEQSNQVVL